MIERKSMLPPGLTPCPLSETGRWIFPHPLSPSPILGKGKIPEIWVFWAA
jgi:hypothetical protein